MLTSVLLVTLDMRGSSSVSFVRRTFGSIFRPVEGVVGVVTEPVGNVWHGITDYD